MLPKGQKGVSRLSVFYKASKTRNVRNKFYSKAQCFRANFSNVSFNNVNFKGAMLTSCSFKKATFSQVEFLGTNLKKSNFTDATFKYCVFSGALMKKVNFRNCRFEKCIFVNTNLRQSKHLVIDDTNRIFDSHPSLKLDSELEYLLEGLRFNPKLHNSRVLHLKGGKLNSLTVQILIERLGNQRLKIGLEVLSGRLPYRVVTANNLFNIIDKASRTA
ncbi:pentapeptide repeat-containing protein [Photobacterium alginatilyticum]|uniref:SV2A/B/C luminal domain-containing protein n=1 Tax=Photobacterium alginatilyticum TaxID=1775171 RepID=A0ABW9YQI7_9GAMM|nr:pentapeptide repeat-containing protein [Photobacterium alginatilyticum]NBI56199.1 hypothetical protein [Photobacterium alginatilyticum]